MTVATRLTFASCLFGLLLLAMLTYHLSVVRHLAATNARLARVEVQQGMLGLELIGLFEELDEGVRRLGVTRDATYVDRLAALAVVTDARVMALEDLIGDAEPSPVAPLLTLWKATGRSLRAVGPSVLQADQGPRGAHAPLTQLLSQLRELRQQAGHVIATARGTIHDQARRSTAVSQRAETVSWGAFAGAALLGFALLVAAVRFINRRLGGLIAATQAVVDGNYDYRLDTSSRDELARLARHFNAMVARLREVEQLKEDFLSHLSHELKTPLASMQETGRVLLDELAGPLTPTQRRLLTLDLRSSARLSTMISKLLDAARQHAGAISYDFKPSDLLALVRACAEQHTAGAHERGLRLRLRLPEEPLHATCDVDRMAQVVGNLLDNAIKFSPRAGTVDLALTNASAAGCDTRRKPGQPGESVALLSVTDAGPGIPPHLFETVFERFAQVRRTSGGVGLGLTICRDVMDAHEGWIWVTNNAGSGCTLWVAIPKERRAGAATGTEVARAA